MFLCYSPDALQILYFQKETHIQDEPLKWTKYILSKMITLIFNKVENISSYKAILFAYCKRKKKKKKIQNVLKGTLSNSSQPVLQLV